MKLKKSNVVLFSLCCFMALELFISVPSGHSEAIEKLSGMKFAKLAMGGILYDNWAYELGVKVHKTHPSYPAEGKKNGKDTWRCKECHGWDYKGAAGAYSKGSHYTGIKGIQAYANQAPEKIVKVLKDDTHALGKMMDDVSLEALSLFVAYGQIDMDLYIDRTSKKSIGDHANGGRIYLSTCIKCHGEDGKDMNFNKELEGKPIYVGTAANENPWETLHKIRWGHPGSQMISLLFLELKEHLDVLAFCQTLP